MFMYLITASECDQSDCSHIICLHAYIMLRLFQEENDANTENTDSGAEQQSDGETRGDNNDNDDSESTNSGAQQQQSPSILALALRFFVTFWTSLIPAPPAEVNAN